MPEKDSAISDNVAALRAKADSEPIASFLKMRLVEISQGYAKVAMKLSPEHINFNGLIFGGIIMALTDESFAYASNTVITPNLASQFNIHFIAAAKVGDELIAECRVIKSGKRVCISEMLVTNQEGQLVAKATGTTIPKV